MYNWLKISHRRHSLRLRPHEYTSYPILFALLLMVGFALTVCSVSAKTPYDGPEASSVALSGVMPERPPSQAAVINSPTTGQSFSKTPVPVTGTCPANTIVEIFKNDIFAGSSPCTSDGTFTVSIDLLTGSNKLIARVYDALDQAGPDSNIVTVSYSYQPPSAAGLAPLSLSGPQMLLSTNAVYRGVFPDQQLSIPVSIIGGTAPYAVQVQWGDSSSKIVPRDNNITFAVAHIYKKPGTYQVTLQATDGQSNVAFLTVATIVNGQAAGGTGTSSGSTGSKSPTSKLLVLWPLYTTAAAVVVSFWYGEKREKRLLGGPRYTFHPQV